MTGQKFLKRIDHGEIAASGKVSLDLEGHRTDFGDNFNTLFITNTDDNDIEIHLDGQKVIFIQGSNGTFSFDWEFGMNFNIVEVENLGAGDVIAANKVKISVGRSGP